MTIKTSASVSLLVSWFLNFTDAFNYLLHYSSEASHHSESLGVHIEPAGLTYAYDEFIYANLVYHIPAVTIDVSGVTDGCTELYKKKLRSEIDDINKNSMSHLQKSIPEYTSTISKPVNESVATRVKRGLPLVPLIAGIAAVAMASMVVANTVEVVKLQTKAIDLETLLNTVRGDQQAFFNKSAEIIDRVNNIGSIIIPDIESTLRSMTIANRCGLDGAALNRKVRSEYNEYSHHATNIINALYDHRIIPEMLSADQLKRDILTKPEFVNSIYSADPMLFYQLTKGYLTSVRHNPFVIAAIMIIPVMSREMIGTTATINRVPVYTNGSFMSIIAPDTVMIDENRKQVWELDHSKCVSVAISHFCPIQTMHKRSNKCVEGLIFLNDSRSCSFAPDDDVPFIKHTLTGLLIGLSNQTIQKISKDRDGKMKTEEVKYTNDQRSIFLPRGVAKEILIDGVVYTLTSPGLDSTPDMPVIHMNVSQDTIMIPNTTLPSIAQLKPLSPVNISWHPVLSSTHVLLFITACGVNIWVLWSLRNRVHTLEILHQHSMRLNSLNYDL